MIHCIPVDGSEPFEIPCDSLMILPVPDIVTAAEFALHGSRGIVEHHGRIVTCYVESWRERAERLEKELAGLRHRIALDAMDKRRESERG